MATTLAARAGRTADRLTVVSAVLHALLVAFAVFLSGQDAGNRAWWAFAGFCALGLVATLLAWASVRAGRAVWNAALAVLLVSLGALVWALTGEGGLGVVAIAIPLMFVDGLLFSNAHRALSRP